MQHDTEREALHELLSTNLEPGHRVGPTATTMDIDDIEEALADEAYYTGGLVHCAMQPLEEDTLFLERAPSPTDPYFTSATTDVELALLRNDEDFFVAREEDPMDVDPDTDPEDYPFGGEQQEDDQGGEQDEDADVDDEQQDVLMEDQTFVALDVYAAEGNGESSGEDDDDDSAEAQARAFDLLNYQTDMSMILKGWTQKPGGTALPDPPSRAHSPRWHSRPTSPLSRPHIAPADSAVCPPSPIMYPIPESQLDARTPSPDRPDKTALFLGSPTPSREATPPPGHDFPVQEDTDQEDDDEEEEERVAPRVRIPARLARFLNLEAQDADGDEEEEEEIVNDRGFIDDSPHNDQAGPSTLPPPLPSNFDDAEQLAADIVRRYRHEYYDDDENPHWQPPQLTVGDVNLDLLPTIDDPELYRVLVGRGREYGFLTWLLKLAEDGYNTHVHTAFTRPDTPSTVFVEVTSGKSLDWALKNQRIRRGQLVPLNERRALLKMPPVEDTDNGWCRIAKPRNQKNPDFKCYAGDLAIRSGSDVAVVPRLKRRQDNAARLDRPPQRLFQAERVKDAVSSVKYSENGRWCKYHGQIFGTTGGLLFLSDVTVVKCTAPATDEEIEFFRPSHQLVKFPDAAAKRSLAIAAGDLVIVPDGARAKYIRGRKEIEKDAGGVWEDGTVGVVVRCCRVEGARFALVQVDYPYNGTAGVDETGVLERPGPHPAKRQALDCKRLDNMFASATPNPPPAARPPPFWISTDFLCHHLLRIPRMLAHNDRVHVVKHHSSEDVLGVVGRVLSIDTDREDKRMLMVTLQPLAPPVLDGPAEDNEPNPEPITVPMHHLEIRFMLGDWVEITRGEHVGQQGFIIGLYSAGVAEIFNFTTMRDLHTGAPRHPNQEAVEEANEHGITVTVPTNHLKFANAGKAPLPTVSTPASIFTPKPIFQDAAGPSGSGPKETPTYWDRKMRAYFSKLFHSGKEFSGRDVTVVGKHDLKGRQGRVMGWSFPARPYKNHKNYVTSYKLAQELLLAEGAQSRQPDNNKTLFEGVKIQVQLARSGYEAGYITDMDIHSVQDSATGLPLSQAVLVPIHWQRTAPVRAQTPPPDPPETPAQKAAAEAKKKEEDGSWLAEVEFRGKHIDVVLDTMSYSASHAKKWAERNTKNHGVDGWVCLDVDSLVGKKKLSVRTSPFGHPVNVPPENLRPARTMKQVSVNPSTTSIADESTRVIVIGPDHERSTAHRGCYARTMPGAAQAPAAGLIQVQFEMTLLGVDGGHGWFPLHSLCRALNKTPPGFDHLETSVFFEPGVDYYDGRQ
ncbi:hypothetical protein C8F04DRAFT_1132492 [Mycena alexandri]|uniref:Chromatin elongation factor spt5 n=1 Tax=Mycena alexandri TaxID=1745969 RepID=A0AAD6WUP1_9AGAR|nr:hypothetical protein C8F04DRAFT_1132492 [Mycena alexandri]